MKYFFRALFISFLLISAELSAQNFEGKLSYSLSYQIKKENQYVKNREEMDGNRMDFYIKDGKYKEMYFYNDELLSEQLYIESENRLYSNYNTNIVHWSDCSYATDTLLSIKMLNDTTIENYHCSKMICETTQKKTIFYVSDSIAVDPESFKDFKMNFWDQSLKKSNGALSVVFSIEYDDYIVTATLQNIELQMLDDSLWVIDKEKILVPNPRELTKTAEVSKGFKAFYKCIGKNLKYPKQAKKNGIEGRVFIMFIVNEDGTLSDIHVARGCSPEIDKEAIRGFNFCEFKWEPAYIDDQPVKSNMVLPITFKL